MNSISSKKVLTCTFFVLSIAFFYFYADSKEILAQKEKLTKIASLNLAADEILIEILEADNSLENLIAVSTLTDQKEYSYVPLETAKKIPFRSNANLEKLIKLSPNLIFTASFNRLSLVSTLKKSGIKVKNLAHFNSLEDLYQNYLLIGKEIRRLKLSEDLVEKLKSSIKSTQKKFQVEDKAKQSVLVWLPDGTCIGKETLLNDVIKSCGGTNVLEKSQMTGWQKIPRERLATFKPDWVISSGDPKKKKKILAQIKKTPILKDFAAVRQEKIILLSPREMSTQSSHIIKTINHVCQRLQKKTKQTKTA